MNTYCVLDVSLCTYCVLDVSVPQATNLLSYSHPRTRLQAAWHRVPGFCFALWLLSSNFTLPLLCSAPLKPLPLTSRETLCRLARPLLWNSLHPPGTCRLGRDRQKGKVKLGMQCVPDTWKGTEKQKKEESALTLSESGERETLCSWEMQTIVLAGMCGL